VGVRADFAFQAFYLARQGFALVFCSHASRALAKADG